MSTVVPTPTTLKKLAPAEALAAVERGAALVDLRGVQSYLDVHIPGSIALLYEAGPGMASRARDCLPPDVPLIVLEAAGVDLAGAAAALRGKGFTVLGGLADAVNAWAEHHDRPPGSTDVVETHGPPEGLVLDVGDPGGPKLPDAMGIPIETLWRRSSEVTGDRPVAIAAGYGVRAAMAVGMLERAGLNEISFWRPKKRTT